MSTKDIKIPKRDHAPSTTIHTRIYAEKQLGDRNVIILVPGGPGNDMNMYDDAEQSIAHTFYQVADVVLFDPRSCGKSAKSDIHFSSLNHYIDDIEALRQQLEIKAEQLYVFGQSYGSIAALGYAIRYPRSLKKLLIIGGAVNASFINSARETLDRIGSPQQIECAKKLWTGTFDGSTQEIESFYTLMTPLYSYSFVPEEPPLEIGYNLEIMNYGWSDFLHSFDFEHNLSDIQCAVLILWGEQEWLFPRAHIDHLHQHIKGAKLKTYQNCMHMLWIDRWEQFKEDSLHFLGGHDDHNPT